jgi:hypothetical protein
LRSKVALRVELRYCADMVRLRILPSGEVKFSETWPARRVEWLLSICLVGVGCIYTFGEGLFQDQLYLVHSRIMPQWLWATGALSIGGLRFAALYINGTWRRSPHLRALGSFLSCFAWFELALAVLQAPIYGATVVIWPVFFVFDVHTTVSAAAEAARADVRHKHCEAGDCDADGGT